MPIHKVKNAQFDEPSVQPFCDDPKISGKVALIIMIVIAVAALGGCAWFYAKYTAVKQQASALATPAGQQEMAKLEVQALLDKIGKLIVLPVGEEPTVATITDADALKKEQQFYQDASTGDKVVIYVQAKKAIIFNEAKNILVNVGPIFVNEPAPAPTTTEEAVN
jgi:hypothetical protein